MLRAIRLSKPGGVGVLGVLAFGMTSMTYLKEEPLLCQSSAWLSHRFYLLYLPPLLGSDEALCVGKAIWLLQQLPAGPGHITQVCGSQCHRGGNERWDIGRDWETNFSSWWVVLRLWGSTLSIWMTSCARNQLCLSWQSVPGSVSIHTTFYLLSVLSSSFSMPCSYTSLGETSAHTYTGSSIEVPHFQVLTLCHAPS